MISKAARRRERRIFAVALLASLLLHMFGVVTYTMVANVLKHLFAAQPEAAATEQLVTTSDAFRIDRRARIAPHQRTARQVPEQRPAAARPPLVAALPQVEMRAPQYAPPWPLKRETMQATPQPLPKAAVKRTSLTPLKPRVLPQPLSPAQIAALTRTFERTIAQVRNRDNPLRPDPAPAAPKRYAVQFKGDKDGPLSLCEGNYWPIKDWTDQSYDYYYAAYRCVWPDGSVQEGGVPWPIRFLVASDPWRNPPLTDVRIPLPLPPRGWTLPPGAHLDNLMRAYLLGHGISVN